MWVYGDQEERVDTRECVGRISLQALGLRGRAPGLEWHGACVGLFLELAGLLQGVADEAFAQAGADERTDQQERGMAALIGLARAVDRSWTTNFDQQDAPAFDPEIFAGLPASVTIKRCEGYAFYAVYPELYLAAAKRLPPGCIVIGLRSIGTGLAALVAAASGAQTAFTLRPVGHPFARTIAAGEALTAFVASEASRTFVLVDEGPGLSGSSLGGAADWLEEQGVARANIVFMPSHGGALGSQASQDHRDRWEKSRRLVASFDEIVAPGLPHWFADITGAPLGALEDLSGGAWRPLTGADAPADPQREARKFLLEAENGSFLLKFIGLDRGATAKFERARQLHVAGFSPEPLAFRYGFLLEPWLAPRESKPVTAHHLARYLGFRATSFPAGPGAPLSRLMEMARHNIGLELGRAADPLFEPWPAERLEALQALVQPVHVDGRLHAWEWICAGGKLLKTDAVDHGEAHDLVGGQDIAWDVAGALIEHDLPEDEAETLVRQVLGGRPDGEALLACMTLGYLGFQIGWWSLSADRKAAERKLFYAGRVRRMLDQCAEA